MYDYYRVSEEKCKGKKEKIIESKTRQPPSLFFSINLFRKYSFSSKFFFLNLGHFNFHIGPQIHSHVFFYFYFSLVHFFYLCFILLFILFYLGPSFGFYFLVLGTTCMSLLTIYPFPSPNRLFSQILKPYPLILSFFKLICYLLSPI